MESGVIYSNESKESEGEQTTVNGNQDPLKISVTEKVIFCIDATAILDNTKRSVVELIEVLLFYIHIKKQISIKPVEFKYLLFYNNGEISQGEIYDDDDLRSELSDLGDLDFNGEVGEFDLSIVFNTLAKTIKLPDPKICKESIPPTWVYHAIFIFGHNIYVPVMNDSNAFDFLVQNPFFNFDTVYIFNDSHENNNCERIANSLYSMYEYLNGYFVTTSNENIGRKYRVFARLLGHPLIRPPLKKYNFNFKELNLKDNLSK